MARFSDLNIRIKFIIAFIFVFLVSIGVAIVLHNAEYKGKKLRERAQRIYLLQNKILSIQNKVNELDVLLIR